MKNKQKKLNRLLQNILFKKIYYFLKHNKIDKRIKISSMGRLVNCKISQEKGTKNNCIEIGEDTSLTNCTIEIHGSNNYIVIGKKCGLTFNKIIIYDDHNSICINDNVKSGHNTSFISLEGGKIEIGKNSLISYDVEIRNSDSHYILTDNQSVLNKGKDIFIGEHVWIAQKALLLKGTIISKGSVVGAGTIITKPFLESNCIIVGVPGKIIKKNIEWTDNRIS